jgi:V/A-type H+-transporting ATPase subunit F
MYKFIVVTDTDTAAGFRLAGVEVVEAKTPEDAKKIIQHLIYQDDTGILAVNEEYMDILDEKVVKEIERTHRPIVIPIPSAVRKGVDRQAYMERLLQKAIGYNIVVRR